MALQKDQTLDTGITVQNAYLRVDSISGNKNQLDFTLTGYVSRQAFLDGKSFICQRRFSFVPSVEEGSENFIKQAYEHLKTMEEYQDAVDILEE